MPMVVMDNETSVQEETLQTGLQASKHTILPLSKVTTAPEPQRPYNPYPATAESRLRAQDAFPSHYSPSAPHGASSPVRKHQWSAATFPPSDVLVGRPEKRLRLDHKQEPDQADIYTRGAIPPTGQHESVPQIRQSLSNKSPHRSDLSDRDVRSPCSNCWGNEDQLSSVVRGLCDLQLELARAFPTRLPQASIEIYPHEVTRQGLKRSLAWSANEIRYLVRVVQGASVATSSEKASLPSLADIVPSTNLGEITQRASLSVQGSALATPTSERRQIPVMSEPSRAEELHGRQTDYTKDYHHPFSEPSLPPVLPSEKMKRSQAYEQGLQGSAQSPHPSVSSSAVGPGQSPMQSQQHQHRSLPSPPGSHFPATGLSGTSPFSTAASQAAQASHLQDLQHQISTKTLALQTLQREHDQLLAAFSRSQIRCNTLDKKSQVSDHEINTLSEEKIRLQQQVESLEAHVEELVKSRDDVHKQSSADGAQWRRIMSMSSQLQIKSAEDARRFKGDRESWEQDKASMELRIQELEHRLVSASTSSHRPGASGVTSGPDDPMTSTSVEVLRQEIVKLRGRCSELELSLQEVTGETEQLDRAINAMSSMRQKLASSRTRRDESG